MIEITGMNPRASSGQKFRSKLPGIIPSAFGGIVRLGFLLHCVCKKQVSRINLIQYMQTKMLYPPALVFFTFFLIACTNNKSNSNDSRSGAKPADPLVASSQMRSSKNIAENITIDSSYTILEDALKATEIIETLGKPGPFTLFAPVNGAFAKLPPGTFQSWMNGRKDDLANILSYHIVAGSIKSGDLEDGQELKTLAGEELIVTKRKDKLLVNGINILAYDLQSSNGTIYIIDGILFPRNQNAGAY